MTCIFFQTKLVDDPSYIWDIRGFGLSVVRVKRGQTVISKIPT